jgi:hypothetical protein
MKCWKEDIMHKAWVLMDSENSVITEEYDTPEEAMKGYTEKELHEAGITCCQLLCDDKCWYECLEEITF